MFIVINTQMLDWGASDFGTDLGRCHFIGAVQNEEESIKVGSVFIDHNRSLSYDECWQQCKYDLVRKMQ